MQTRETSRGDFLALLRAAGHPFAARPAAVPSPTRATTAALDTHSTTVIALKFAGGVLNVGDRRATAANAIMYDRADKIQALDDSTLLAISGSYAKAMEVIRYLRHAFQYYRRTQLQEMSLDGKLSEVSRVIAQNVQNALTGIGAFLPVFSAYDPERAAGRIFFFDGLGAHFESPEWAAAGSGAERIRGAFDYILKTQGPFHAMSLEQTLRHALVLLDIAAEMDSATGGYEKVLPSARTVTAQGVQSIPDEQLRDVLAQIGKEA
ncbi:MAG: proteasome subunit alpha [Armatimonadota bacterium]|nr:proteasome subunit alpha [Armatimonadota bacterium]